jgi:hypothetical protein
MLDDFIRGIREYVSDRFMSPLGASLTVSWCLLNYKALIVILSGESALRKIHLIHLVYQDPWYAACHLAIGPALVSLVYIFAFPYPSKWVYSYSLRRRKETLELKRKIEDQIPLTQEESRNLRKRFDDMELEHTSAGLRLSTRIDSLKEQLKSAVEERDALRKELYDIQTTKIDPTIELEESPTKHIQLSKVQLRVLDAIGRHGNEVPIRILSDQLGLGESVIWFIAGELEDYGLAYVEDDDPDMHLSQRAALTEMGLRVFMSHLE